MATDSDLYQSVPFEIQTVIEVPAGTTASEIQSIIDTAPPGALIQLAAGQYTIDQTLLLQRSDIALLGSGEGETVLKASSSLKSDSVIQIGHELYRPEYTGNFELDKSASVGSSTLRLDDADGLQAGDTLWLERENTDDFFDEIGDTQWQKDKPLRTSLVTVVDVDGDTVTFEPPLSFDFDPDETTVRRIETVENVALGGFTIEGAYGEADPSKFSNTKSSASGQAAVSVAGTENATLFNIDIEDTASMGFVFAKSLYVDASHLTVDGAHNKGGGGEGYAVWIRDVYNSEFTDLSVYDTRHAVVFASYTSATGNYVHVADTNRDINFHGGRDHGNKVVVDNSVREGAEQSYMAWVAFVNEGTSYGAPTDPDANEVTFRNVVGTSKGDWINAHEDGATIDGAGGSDLIRGGAGNDSLFGNEGHDRFVGLEGFDLIDGGSGTDVLQVDLERSETTLLKTTEGYLLYAGTGAALLTGVETLDLLDGSYSLSGAPQTDGFYTLDHDLVFAAGANGWQRATVTDSTLMGEGLEAVKLSGGKDVTIVGNELANNVISGSGDDVITGLGGDDRLFGKSGDDILDGGDGDDFLNGDHGNDVLIGGNGNDVLLGRRGEDLFIASGGSNVVQDFDVDEDSFLFDDLSSAQIEDALLSFLNTGRGRNGLEIEELLGGNGYVSLTSAAGDNLTLENVSVQDLLGSDSLFA
jgi:Ca2+-binding RTX toxin-like protein